MSHFLWNCGLDSTKIQRFRALKCVSLDFNNFSHFLWNCGFDSTKNEGFGTFVFRVGCCPVLFSLAGRQIPSSERQARFLRVW
ncbi:hypothetical protein B1R32_103242 [Abditibacterium utsteinense]|uniref:Uncharacterized protein n=1 Tax=Abditibacterium utsteinense TaxID=1960156 RepID=A0A2S8SW04_9BACT|nr:hypothetical protein B1R32_103242 [Abditibacterium utsteinense]